MKSYYPLNIKTNILFELPEDLDYTLEIHDIDGKMLKQLRDQGKVGLNRIEIASDDLPVGVMYYELKAGSYADNKKMILLK